MVPWIATLWDIKGLGKHPPAASKNSLKQRSDRSDRSIVLGAKDSSLATWPQSLWIWRSADSHSHFWCCALPPVFAKLRAPFWLFWIWWCTLGFNKTEVKVSGHVNRPDKLEWWCSTLGFEFMKPPEMKWSLMHGHFPNYGGFTCSELISTGWSQCSGEQSSRTSGWWRQGSGACAQDRWRHGHWGTACEPMAPYIPWVYYTGPWADNSWIDHLINHYKPYRATAYSPILSDIVGFWDEENCVRTSSISFSIQTIFGGI